MNQQNHKSPPDKTHRTFKEFHRLLKIKSLRKLKARREKENGIFFGLGMIGLVGWSVAIPTLIGIFVGVWIDNRFPSRYSWTLMLLFIGVVLGCLNAWFWVQQESQED
ncbi:MAG: AtpZ/AtpI family protein [Nostocaceae cyanobacterium]|nr:AtpZ/AtpI family protein [Nostocaceae cyanobacterium]